MSVERIPREALMPWLALAGCLHAAAMLGLRFDLSAVRPRERPVLEVSLATEGAAGFAAPAAESPSVNPTPAPVAAASAKQAGPSPDPVTSDGQAGPGSDAHQAVGVDVSGPAAVTGEQRREVEPEPAKIQPVRPVRTPSGDRAAQRRSSVANTVADTAEDSVPEENPTRVDVATLQRQATDWSAEYSQRASVEPSLPPRTAYVEKVVSNRVAASAYERDWQDKVERVGNMNYPEEARRKNLSGGLMLSVGVNADGTVHGIRVHRSSGHEELDEAAQRIVRLAAPYAAFPEDLKKDYDVLWITRTWRFYVDNHLATSP
jgi:periplasmic protein TonB